jgi:hypothetical protein
MSEVVQDILVVRNNNNKHIISLDANIGTIKGGGLGTDAKLVIKTKTNTSILLAARGGKSAYLSAGGGSLNGRLRLERSRSTGGIDIDSEKGNIAVYRRLSSRHKIHHLFHFEADTGSLILNRQNSAKPAWLKLGAKANPGNIAVSNGKVDRSFEFKGYQGRLVIGCPGTTSHVRFMHKDKRPIFDFISKSGEFRVGHYKHAGTVKIKDKFNREAIRLIGQHAHLDVGCKGNEGDITVNDGKGRKVFHFNSNNARLRLGGLGNDGDISVQNSLGMDTIRLNGNTGEISCSNCDCAEEFDISGNDKVDAGTVLVLDDNCSLRPCDTAYDSKVAGVVSGAGGWKPGIVLGKTAKQSGRMPIALNGRVYCKVDASTNPVAIGDLLTTSDVQGYAMKASDPMRSFGTVIGKAMKSLDKDRGLIPILVSLQ